MNHSESITALAAALAKAQAAIQPAIKDKKNEAFKSGGKVSKYADLASVWDACREALTNNGLSVVQMPVDAEMGRVALTTVLLHSSGEYISSTVSTRLVNDTPQGVGSALTYLRRYSLSAMVGVVADEDDDGNAASLPQQQARPAGRAEYVPAPEPRTNGAEAAEARRKFYERWSPVAGTTWAAVQGYIGKPYPEPTTLDGWRDAWKLVQDAHRVAQVAAEYDQIEEGNR